MIEADAGLDEWQKWLGNHRTVLATTIPACSRSLASHVRAISQLDPTDAVGVKRGFREVASARRTLLHAIESLSSAEKWLDAKTLRRFPQGWGSTIVHEDSLPPDADAYHAWAWISDNALRFRDIADSVHKVREALEGARRGNATTFHFRAQAVAAAIFELRAAVLRVDPSRWSES